MTTITVSQLNQQANQLLGEAFAQVEVSGEIRGLVRARSGHIYFKLADDKAQLDCAFFKGQARFCRLELQEDLQVVVAGRLGIYEQGGRYQLIVRRIEPAGESALAAQRERIRQMLAARGLFDARFKSPLPELPQRIAVISSPSGAAIADVQATLSRRLPVATVTLFPVLVQGEQACAQICQALTNPSLLEADVVLMVRGGGSISELWVFNEPQLIEAVFHCPVPVVSGIGHESDHTLVELVADHRAATPTAAAELATPVTSQQMQQQLQRWGQRSSRAMRWYKQQYDQQHDRLVHRLSQSSPANQLATARSALQLATARLHHHQHTRINQQRARLAAIVEQLRQYHPGVFVRRMQRQIAPLGGQLRHAWQQQQSARHHQLDRKRDALNRQIQQYHHRQQQTLGLVAARLNARSLRYQIAQAREDSRQSVGKARRAIDQQLYSQRQHRVTLARTLHALGPQQVLKRGYSIVTDPSGQQVYSRVADFTAQADQNNQLAVRLRLADGQVALEQAVVRVDQDSKGQSEAGS